MYRAIYKDQNGVPRVWGTGLTKIKASMAAYEQLKEYQPSQPDLWFAEPEVVPIENNAWKLSFLFGD